MRAMFEKFDAKNKREKKKEKKEKKEKKRKVACRIKWTKEVAERATTVLA